jgi:hypothetical protein
VSRTTLATGAIYAITEEDAIVSCAVVNRVDISPNEGATCAQQMHSFLSGSVLSDRSRYLGLIFDVREGPAVFGPQTRAALERIFRQAEETQRALAVQVGEAAIQRLQFTNLCAVCAPRWSKVFDREGAADWVRARAAGAN